MTRFTTVKGDLGECLSQLQPGTMRHVDELNEEYQANFIDADGTDLGRVWLYAADGGLYSVVNGIPTLSLVRADHNPILRHINDALQVTTTGDRFRPNFKEVQQALKADSTLHIDLTQLSLIDYSEEHQCLVVPTEKNHGLNKEGEKLARRVFGNTIFDQKREIFRDAGISELEIYVVGPNYVREFASEHPLAYSSLFRYSMFHANFRFISTYCRSRGEPLDIAKTSIIHQE